MLLVSCHVFFPFSEDTFKVKEQGCVGWEVGGFFSVFYSGSLSVPSLMFPGSVQLPHLSCVWLLTNTDGGNLIQKLWRAGKLVVTFTMSRLQLSCHPAWCCSPRLSVSAGINTVFELVLPVTSLLSLHMLNFYSILHNHKHITWQQSQPGFHQIMVIYSKW